jgi:2-polyprenyl-6-methoxyphenol hydroxylase-like FAD-dependent oxidoreductase
VLIAGAGIAGPALAYWLGTYGWRTVVVERAPSLRIGGQNVDVRGAGREVARRMGIEADIRAAGTGEEGTRFVGPDGRVVAEFPAGTSDSDGATAELEILRGDLVRLLVDATRVGGPGKGDDGTEYIWGDQIIAMDADGSGVIVTFANRTADRYDLVVAADGVGSSTRGLAFAGDVEIRSLGLETTWLTIPRTATDQDWWRWYNATGGRTVTLRPDPVGTIRATLSSLTGPGDGGPWSRSRAEHARFLRERFAGAGWETPRILSGLEDAEDVYAQQVAQVHAPAWSGRRFALVGDAAYCPSPVSGMGTSLALVGAYVLAGELASHVHHRDALLGYERIMRPYVRKAQHLPPGTPRLAHPKTALGVHTLRLAMRLAASPAAAGARRRLLAPPADQITLPSYAHLERTVS